MTGREATALLWEMPGPLRATGDPDALYNAGAAILVPDTLQERNRLGDELVELAQR